MIFTFLGATLLSCASFWLGRKTYKVPIDDGLEEPTHPRMLRLFRGGQK